MSEPPVVDGQSTTALGSMIEPAGTVVVTEKAGQVIAHVRGEIDLATGGRLREAIEPHLGPRQRVVVDLSGVSFMDSECLRVLLQARTTLTTDGGSLVLRNPSAAARRLLSASGTAVLFDAEVG